MFDIEPNEIPGPWMIEEIKKEKGKKLPEQPAIQVPINEEPLAPPEIDKNNDRGVIIIDKDGKEEKI